MIGKSLSSAALVAGLVFFAFGGAGCTATAAAGPAGPSAPIGASCDQDSSVNCAGGGTGYSCGGGDAPSDSDSSLACSIGVVASGETLYCCVSFTSSTCMPDDSVQGCTGYSYGFSCSGTDSPDDADSSLTCSQATQGNGALLYCCTN